MYCKPFMPMIIIAKHFFFSFSVSFSDMPQSLVSLDDNC